MVGSNPPRLVRKKLNMSLERTRLRELLHFVKERKMFFHETKTETVDQDAFRKQLCVEIAIGIYNAGLYANPEIVGRNAVETLLAIEKILDDERKSQPVEQ